MAAAIMTEIINEFVDLIDTDKEYDLKELKQILSDVYNTKTGKKKAVKKVVAVKPESPKVESEDDDDKPKKRGRPAKAKTDKPKKAPNAYNLFVKQNMENLKKENPDTPAKSLMSLAAAKWKELSDEEKAEFKASVVSA